MAKVIDITIRDKIAKAPDDALYICGNSDFVINFDFDEEWQEHNAKTARFVYGLMTIDVVFTGNQCHVPVISDVYSFMVGVYAGDLRTTTPALVSAKKSILCGGGTPVAPEPDVYNQMMLLFDEKVTEAQGYAESAEKANEAALEAQQLAEETLSKVETAQETVDDALEKTEDALRKAEAAQESAEEVRKAVEGSVGQAEHSANEAASSAEHAAEYANLAEQNVNTALQNAMKSGAFDGADGKDGQDGYTPVKGVDYFDGEDGKDGVSVSVQSVSESTEDGGENIVTFTDGKTLKVQNGSKGSKGDKGDKGEKGDKGADGTMTFEDLTPEQKASLKGDKGDTGEQGPPGEKGEKGDPGEQGIQGPAYTLTDTDKNTIASQVKASLTTENWTFTLEDGSTTTKAVYVG